MPGVVGVVTVDDGPAAARLLRGTPLLVRSVLALLTAECLDALVVTVPPGFVDPVRSLLSIPRVIEAADGRVLIDVLAEAGVGTATHVSAALHATLPDYEVVMVHDASHPLATAGQVRQVLGVLLEAMDGDSDVVAAVPVRPVIDTLKLVDGADVITSTVARDRYRQAYTPQAFLRAPLMAALAAATEPHRSATGPDALPRLAQAMGRLLSVPAPGELVRITSPEDLVLAEAMLPVQETFDPPARRRRRP